MSIILHNRDIRSHLSDCKPASSLDFLGWCGASMSPFYTEGDLEGRYFSFSPSVRSRRRSQVERAVLRQDAAVRRDAPRVIRTMRAQKSAPFPGIAPDVLARLHISPDVQKNLPLSDTAGEVGDMGDATPDVSTLLWLRYTTRACCRPDTVFPLCRPPRRWPCGLHPLQTQRSPRTPTV